MAKMSPSCPHLDLYKGLKAALLQGSPHDTLLEAEIDAKLKALGLHPLQRDGKASKAPKELSEEQLPRTLREPLECLEWCYRTGRAALIQGPAMSGKRMLVKHWTHRRKKELIEAVLHPETSEQDLFGHMVPSLEKDPAKASPFVWHDGPVRQAALRGSTLLLKGLHLPSVAVLESLNAILLAKPGDHFMLAGRPCQVVEGFHVVATMIPSHARELSPAFLSRFLRLHVSEGIPKDDAKRWLSNRLPTSCKHLCSMAEEQLEKLKVRNIPEGDSANPDSSEARDGMTSSQIHFGYLEQMLVAWHRLETFREQSSNPILHLEAMPQQHDAPDAAEA